MSAESGQRSRKPPVGCPRGLEVLTSLNQIIVHQQSELLEVFSGWETSNRYAIKNQFGKQLFFVAEDAGCCCRLCCGPHRSFAIHIMDGVNREVMRVVRPFRCCCCGSCSQIMSCCRIKMEVQAPVGVTVGRLTKSYSCCAPTFSLSDSQGQVRLLIKGPLCVCSLPCYPVNQEFRIYNRDGKTQVGVISKECPASNIKELLTVADNFTISFPKQMDVKLKALLIGAAFVIDFLYFEKKADQSEDHKSFSSLNN